MSERNEFDDLARRKLEEREFPFHEADWLEAQHLIAQQRSSGIRPTWLLTGIGLVLIGTSVWFLTTDRSIPEELVEVSAIATNEKNNAPTPRNTTTEEPRTIEHAPSNALPDQVLPVGPSNDIASTRSIDPVTVTQGPRSRADHREISTSHPAPVPEGAVVAEHEAAGPSPAMTIVAATPQATLQTPQATGNATSTGGIAAVPQVLGGSDSSPTATSTPTGSTDPGGENTDNVQPTTSPVTTGPELSVATTQLGTTVDPPAEDAGASGLASYGVDTSATTTDPSEALSGQPTVQVQDSAAPAVAVPPPPPLVTPDQPWEIGVLFGGLLSLSTYSGGNSAEWIDGQTGRWSPAFGGEVMHMGRNFGIGSGLHYSTYQEDLHIAERSLTTTVVQDSSYFQPFNTTVLYVLGNVIIDGEQYYITGSRDTTINILVLGTTSRTTTRRLIDARDVTNRVSYLEVPLLLDAHVVQGAWALGLRGGPTVGLLNEQRGAVPNAAFDGYTDFATEQFRSPVFGFTARAYLRYRWVNGWSVGVEPTWRGHFGNALNNDELTRKSSTLGGMVSVSYRLR